MSETPVDQKNPIAKRSLTDEEKAIIARTKKKNATSPIFRSKASDSKDTLELAWDPTLEGRDAAILIEAQLCASTGSTELAASLRMLNNVAKCMIPAQANSNEIAQEMNALALSMQSLAPQDEFEGQLVAQLVVLHEQALNWLGRALRSERVDFANVYLNGASKLLTRHHEALESLLKYRRKGEQRVHVEHVHVHDGGQAIVGNVSPGGGSKPNLEEGPHAKV